MDIELNTWKDKYEAMRYTKNNIMNNSYIREKYIKIEKDYDKLELETHKIKIKNEDQKKGLVETEEINDELETKLRIINYQKIDFEENYERLFEELTIIKSTAIQADASDTQNLNRNEDTRSRKSSSIENKKQKNLMIEDIGVQTDDFMSFHSPLGSPDRPEDAKQQYKSNPTTAAKDYDQAKRGGDYKHDYQCSPIAEQETTPEKDEAISHKNIVNPLGNNNISKKRSIVYNSEHKMKNSGVSNPNSQNSIRKSSGDNILIEDNNNLFYDDHTQLKVYEKNSDKIEDTSIFVKNKMRELEFTPEPNTSQLLNKKQFDDYKNSFTDVKSYSNNIRNDLLATPENPNESTPDSGRSGNQDEIFDQEDWRRHADHAFRYYKSCNKKLTKLEIDIIKPECDKTPGRFSRNSNSQDPKSANPDTSKNANSFISKRPSFIQTNSSTKKKYSSVAIIPTTQFPKQENILVKDDYKYGIVSPPSTLLQDHKQSNQHKTSEDDLYVNPQIMEDIDTMIGKINTQIYQKNQPIDFSEYESNIYNEHQERKTSGNTEHKQSYNVNDYCSKDKDMVTTISDIPVSTNRTNKSKKDQSQSALIVKDAPDVNAFEEYENQDAPAERMSEVRNLQPRQRSKHALHDNPSKNQKEMESPKNSGFTDFFQNAQNVDNRKHNKKSASQNNISSPPNLNKQKLQDNILTENNTIRENIINCYDITALGTSHKESVDTNITPDIKATDLNCRSALIPGKINSNGLCSVFRGRNKKSANTDYEKNVTKGNVPIGGPPNIRDNFGNVSYSGCHYQNSQHNNSSLDKSKGYYINDRKSEGLQSMKTRYKKRAAGLNQNTNLDSKAKYNGISHTTTISGSQTVSTNLGKKKSIYTKIPNHQQQNLAVAPSQSNNWKEATNILNKIKVLKSKYSQINCCLQGISHDSGLTQTNTNNNIVECNNNRRMPKPGYTQGSKEYGKTNNIKRGGSKELQSKTSIINSGNLGNKAEKLTGTKKNPGAPTKVLKSCELTNIKLQGNLFSRTHGRETPCYSSTSTIEKRPVSKQHHIVERGQLFPASATNSPHNTLNYKYRNLQN